MAKFSSSIIGTIGKRLVLLLVVIQLLSTVLLPVFAYAVNENTGNIPAGIISTMKNSWGQIDGGPNTAPGNQCGVGNSKYNNAQWNWVSPDNDAQVTRNLGSQANALQVVEGTGSSLPLRLNTLGAYCDRIIHPRDYSNASLRGVISNKTLDRTRNTIHSNARVEVMGSAVGSGLSLAGLEATNNNHIEQNYDRAKTQNNRYAKRENGDLPVSKDFTIRGLDKLPSATTPYRIKITIPVRGVNLFNQDYIVKIGNQNVNLGRYPCIANPKGANDISDTGRECLPNEIVAFLYVNIRPNWGGVCSIDRIIRFDGQPPVEVNGNTDIPMAPNEKFKAVITVRNTAYNNWPVDPAVQNARVVLATPGGVKTFGSNRIAIPGYNSNVGKLIYGSGGTSDPALKVQQFTASQDFTAPSSGKHSFDWQIIRDQSGLAPISEVCDSPKKVTVTIKQNTPYLRVSGGDVVAGAQFGGSELLTCTPGNFTLDSGINAPIDANGYYQESTGAPAGNTRLGSSSGQYAVLASGLIGSKASDTGSNFLGNNLWTRDGRKDFLFGNIGLTVPSNYGRFYSGGKAGIPCIDVAKLTSGSVDQNNKNINEFINDASDGTGKFTGPRTIGDGFPRPVTNAQSTKVVIVQGDLTVGGNVNYKASYSGLSDIPNLVVVVFGNIKINSNVTKMDGTYIAFPTKDGQSADGIIDTCANYGTFGRLPDEGAGGLSTTSCQNKLTINGRLIARDFAFKRTNGTTGNNTTAITDQPSLSCIVGQGQFSISKLEDCAAEFINFSAEAYFNSPGVDGDPETNVGNVPKSSRELPPIY